MPDNLPSFWKNVAEFSLHLDVVFSYFIFFAVIYDVSLLIVILNQISKRNTVIRSSYFVMFMIVLIVNLVTPLAAIRTIRKAEECDYSEVDLSKTNNVAYDDYYNIYDYYLCFFSSASGLMLTINRMTAVLMPFKHNKIWDAKNTIIASLFMLLLPIPSAVFGQIMVRKELQTLITFITAIISFICIVLSLLLSFGLYFRVICTIQRIKESAKVQMKYERRLLAVIMFSNIGGFLYLLARYGAFIIDHIEPHDKYFEDFLHNMGSVLYIIFHYGELVFLMIMSKELRNCYLSFYFWFWFPNPGTKRRATIFVIRPRSKSCFQ